MGFSLCILYSVINIALDYILNLNQINETIPKLKCTVEQGVGIIYIKLILKI